MNNSTSSMKLTNSFPHLKVDGKVDKQLNDSDDRNESAHFSESFSSLNPSSLAKSQKSSDSSSKKSFSESCASLDASSLASTTKSQRSSKSSKKSFSASCSSLDPASLASTTKSRRSSKSSAKKKKKKEMMSRSTSTDTLYTNMSVESATEFWETEVLFWHSIASMSSMPPSSNRANNKQTSKETNDPVDQKKVVWGKVESPEEPIPLALSAKYARKPNNSVQPQTNNAPNKNFDAKKAFKTNVCKLQTVIALSNNSESNMSAQPQKKETASNSNKFDAKKTFNSHVRKFQTIMALKNAKKK